LDMFSIMDFVSSFIISSSRIQNFINGIRLFLRVKRPLSDTEKEIRSRLSESILFSELNGN